MSRSWLPARKPRSTGARLSRFGRAKIEIACGAFPHRRITRSYPPLYHMRKALTAYTDTHSTIAPLHFDYLNPEAK
jgi:hypothetical protein